MRAGFTKKVVLKFHRIWKVNENEGIPSERNRNTEKPWGMVSEYSKNRFLPGNYN